MIIYKTINKINGKIYIGKSKYNNPNYYGSGIILHNAIKKYGIENFSKIILEFCNDESLLNEREKYWISFLKSYISTIGYNLTMGGDGGALIGKSLEKMRKSLTGRRHLDSTKRKLSLSQKGKHIGERNNMYGKKPWNYGLTKETNKILKNMGKNISKTHVGKPLSDEHKKKLSESHKGKNKYKKSEEHKEKISNSLKNKPLSEETKIKMSNSKKGKRQTIITCPHCGKSGGIPAMKRWHFDNCGELKWISNK